MSNPLMESNSEQIDMAKGRNVFKVLGSLSGGGCTARLGRLSLPNRKNIDTPNFTASTSRGVIPHLTPEVVSNDTSIGSAYFAIEDFLEKKEPPILKTPRPDNNTSVLQSFTSFPKDITTILAARRCPSVVPPAGNSAKQITIFTSTGFLKVTVAQYAAAVDTLRPDIAIPLADLPHVSLDPVPKKQLRMAERTDDWVDEFLKHLSEESRSQCPEISVFAPVLPLEHSIQWSYLRHLADDLAGDLSGLAIYNVNILPDLPEYKALLPLPRLSLDLPQSPHDILRQVSLGIDLALTPFVNSTSDSGVAFAFNLSPSDASSVQPLGIDLWSPEHSTSLAPLVEGCQCYTCRRHHRAFLNHLLNAKEMLGWNLLQIHNHHVLDEFFAGIRESLAKGEEDFKQVVQKFSAAYETEFPVGTGERPRSRGYHLKSEASQEKINKPAWKEMNGAKIQTPLLPDGDGQTLADQGFAQKEIV